MRKYDRYTIENMVSQFEGYLINEIAAIKIYNILCIENHFGNICYYGPERGASYVVTLSEAKEVCQKNRKSGRNFSIEEEVFLGIQLDCGDLFLLNDFRGMCYMGHIINKFHNRCDVSFYNLIMYLFMLASIKNNNMICLQSKYKIKDIECVHAGVGLNRYCSNFEFGILGWDRYKVQYNGECPAIAASLSILLDI